MTFPRKCLIPVDFKKPDYNANVTDIELKHLVLLV